MSARLTESEIAGYRAQVLSADEHEWAVVHAPVDPGSVEALRLDRVAVAALRDDYTAGIRRPSRRGGSSVSVSSAHSGEKLGRTDDDG